jgi:hypothetical protein
MQTGVFFQRRIGPATLQTMPVLDYKSLILHVMTISAAGEIRISKVIHIKNVDADFFE